MILCCRCFPFEENCYPKTLTFYSVSLFCNVTNKFSVWHRLENGVSMVTNLVLEIHALCTCIMFMFLIFFMIPVLTTWRKTFLGCQTYIVIILGEVISISTFQELKHTVLGHFFIMPLLIGIGCLMISSQSLWNLFLKEVLKLTF